MPKEGSVKDWMSFYESMDDDKPSVWCTEILKTFHYAGYRLIFVSGRPERYRERTELWLLKKARFLRDWYSLFMRLEKDNRPDFQMKEEVYHRYIEPNYNVLFILEDRKQCVDMYRELGLTVLQCKEGNY